MKPKRCIYTFKLEKLSRSQKRNAVQMCAYLLGQRMKNWATRRTFSRRTIDSDVQFEMLGTSASPETFFNLAEAAEKRKDDAIVARTVVVALPCGVPPDVQFRMLVEIAQVISLALGTPVLIVRHQKSGETEEERNPHGHLLFATRDWDESTFSFAKKKNRKLDDWRTGRALIEEFRVAWENILNANLAPGKLPADRRSHWRRGEKRLPCVHLGRTEIEREKRTGKPSPLRALNALIENHARLQREVTACTTEIEELEQAIALANTNAPTQNPTTSSTPAHKDKAQLPSRDAGTTQPLAPPASVPVVGSSIPNTAKSVVDPHAGMGAQKIDLSDAADVLVPSKPRRSRPPKVSDGTQQPESISEATPEPLQQPISRPISAREIGPQFADNADTNQEVREKPTVPGTGGCDFPDAGDVLAPPAIPAPRTVQKRQNQKFSAQPGEKATPASGGVADQIARSSNENARFNERLPSKSPPAPDTAQLLEPLAAGASKRRAKTETQRFEETVSAGQTGETREL